MDKAERPRIDCTARGQVLCAVGLALLHATLRGPGTEQLAHHDSAEQVRALEARLRTVALRSTVTAGYVFYHLATFATDVRDYGGGGGAYLTVHALAFALGLTSCTIAHITCFALSNAHVDSRRSMLQAAVSVEKGVSGCYWLSLVFFVVGFGLIGLKRDLHGLKRDTELFTVWLAGIALAGLALAAAACLVWQRRAQMEATPAAGRRRR